MVYMVYGIYYDRPCDVIVPLVYLPRVLQPARYGRHLNYPMYTLFLLFFDIWLDVTRLQVAGTGEALIQARFGHMVDPRLYVFTSAFACFDIGFIHHVQ